MKCLVFLMLASIGLFGCWFDDEVEVTAGIEELCGSESGEPSINFRATESDAECDIDTDPADLIEIYIPGVSFEEIKGKKFKIGSNGPAFGGKAASGRRESTGWISFGGGEERVSGEFKLEGETLYTFDAWVCGGTGVCAKAQ